MSRRVGVLGGTFDPVHVGHLFTAVEVRHELKLDTVLLMVAGSPWQKVGSRELAPAVDRLALVEAAIAGVEGLETSSLELEREGPTYTADTLAALRSTGTSDELFLIVGADVASELDTWERVHEVKELATLAVVERPGSSVDLESLRQDGWRIADVVAARLEVSSSDLRERLGQGRPVDFLIPAAAIREIRKRGLYPAGR